VDFFNFDSKRQLSEAISQSGDVMPYRTHRQGRAAGGGPPKGHSVNSATPLFKIIPNFNPFPNTNKGQYRCKPKVSFGKNRFSLPCFKSSAAVFLGQDSGKNYTWTPGKICLSIIFGNCKQLQI